MSNVQTSAGSVLALVNALPTTYDSVGYGALTFVTVGEVTDHGELGREYDLVTHNPVATRGTVKRKGNYNDGSMALTIGRDPADAGQVLLEAGADLDTSHSFKLTLQNGDVKYFTGQIMSYKTTIGSGNQITGCSCSIEIDTAVVTVLA